MSLPPRRFETPREIAVIVKILADLVRTIQLIECEIAAQEERASVSDRSDVKYPMLARTLTERRDNLKMTIDALEQRLAERTPDEQATSLLRRLQVDPSTGISICVAGEHTGVLPYSQHHTGSA
jgi:hypothetical protein